MSDASKLKSHPHTNRLAKETSPYLLQHAHNPVDWYAWGPEAFERARRENKPIFLSVGYSTCYWCHVMERQSFENEAIAAEMNKRFVNIKVDREERPDVDQLYMTAVQVLTRQGGWPMSVFLTPDLKPFYGGTYFPPTDAYGRPGFPTLLAGIEDAYRNRKSDVDQTAKQIVDILNQLAEPSAPQESITIDDAFVDALIDRSVADYEPRHGGFGGAPKFPRETLLELLLVHNRHFPNESRLKMLRHTLDAMAAGGIHDQLGGGFHRYSTDDKWLVPHFEIMLYDNAMLAWCYVESHAQTNDANDARVARGIFDFILREMTSPQGAFYTAFDAEVDAQEGLSYLWTRNEVEQTLNEAGIAPADIAWFTKGFGLDDGPNFADPHHGNGTPETNILFVKDPDAKDSSKSTAMRQALLAARSKRKQPLLDTKILTSWNALMIRALAHGAKVLNEPRYLDAASRAATFLLKQHRAEDGTLRRTSRDGDARIAAFVDDYAYLAQACLALADAGAGKQWRDEAATIANTVLARFGDDSRGGLFFTDRDANDLIVRQKTASDSPLPSGNAVAAMALLELGRIEDARKILAIFAQQLENQGEGMSAMIEAITLYLRRSESFTVSASKSANAADRPLSPQQLAASVVTLRDEWRSPTELSLHVSILKGFHINANVPAENLIATTLSVTSGQEIASIEYPPAQEQRFAFAPDAPIRVYVGDVAIVVRFKLPVNDATSVKLNLTYQACDDNACLPPVTKQIELREQ